MSEKQRFFYTKDGFLRFFQVFFFFISIVYARHSRGEHRSVIGASASEPHSQELNSKSVTRDIYIYIYLFIDTICLMRIVQ